VGKVSVAPFKDKSCWETKKQMKNATTKLHNHTHAYKGEERDKANSYTLSHTYSKHVDFHLSSFSLFGINLVQQDGVWIFFSC